MDNRMDNLHNTDTDMGDTDTGDKDTGDNMEHHTKLYLVNFLLSYLKKDPQINQIPLYHDHSPRRNRVEFV